MNEDLRTQITIIFLGGMVGLFPILLTTILSWVDKRSRASKQNKALELAKSRIDFIEKWVKVQETLNSKERFEEIKKESADELIQIRKGLSEILVVNEKAGEENEKNIFQQAFLFYRPFNFYSWVMHIGYYLVIVITILFIITFQPGVDLETDVFSWDRLFIIDLPIIIVALIPPIIIRGITIWVDRKANKELNSAKSS